MSRQRPNWQSRPRYVGPALAICLGFLLASTAAGQPANPQEKQEIRPRLVLNTLGPAGISRTLAFSNDSQRLFAAGSDKVVHVWQADWDVQADPSVPIRLQPSDTLRWEIARAIRGSINSLAVCPTREEIAIGGSSARDPYGDIVLFDTSRRTLLTSLPTGRDRQSGLPGHRAVVVRLDYSPDGRSLVSISEDGETILWRPQDAQRQTWSPTVIRPPGPTFNWHQVSFVNDRMIVVTEPARPDDLGAWRLAVYEVAPAPRRVGTLPAVHVGRVTDIARSRDLAYWASSDMSGAVYLWKSAQIEAPIQLRRGPAAVSCLAFGTRGQLAVGTELGPRGEPSKIELWDAAAGRLVDHADVSATESCHSSAISPDGRLLVTQDVETSELVAFRLRLPTDQNVSQPLSGPPATRVAGRGQSVRQVAVAAGEGGSYLIGLSPKRKGPLTKAFDVSRSLLLDPPPEGIGWTMATQLNQGWQLAARGEPRTDLELDGPGQSVRIRLDFDAQGAYKTHCLIPAPDGRPAAVAIGTDTHFGIFIYSLPGPAGQPPRLLRHLRDHQDAVTCLTVSADGRYLLSGSDDQTVKVWSLEDLFRQVPGFPNAAAWGAEFPVVNGQVTATRVLPVGIAFGRGIRDGDVITMIETFDAQGKYVQSQDPQVIQQILGTNPIYRITQLHGQRNGQPLPLPLIMPAWEPLLTLFVENRGEWAIWHPEGYFNSSVAEGGELFGWQINQGPNVPPRLIRAAFMQKEFERPDVIERLLQVGNLNDALAAAGLPVFAGYQEHLVSVIQQTPQVRVLRPRADELLLDNPGQQAGSVIEAEVVWPPGVGEQQFDVRASIGGRNLSAPQAGPRQDNRQTFRWPIESYDLLNRIEVLVNERGNPALRALYAADKVYVRGDRPQPTPYTLHTLVLAADAYQGRSGAQFQALKYSRADAQEIIGRLKSKELNIGFYRMGETRLLVDQQITRDRVLSEIQHIHSQIGNPGKKEVVLVYIRGHGVESNGNYFFIPVTAVNNSQVESHGIPWSVFAQLADLPCHVIWMVDTCQSGRIDDAKAVVREAQRLMSLIIMAVPGKEEQTEGEIFVQGHTPFAYGLLSGLDGDADGYFLDTTLGPRRGDDRKDSKVDVHELTYYIKGVVNEETLGRIEPRSTPSDLADLIQLPLLRVP